MLERFLKRCIGTNLSACANNEGREKFQYQFAVIISGNFTEAIIADIQGILHKYGLYVKLIII